MNESEKLLEAYTGRRVGHDKQRYNTMISKKRSSKIDEQAQQRQEERHEAKIICISIGIIINFCIY